MQLLKPTHNFDVRPAVAYFIYFNTFVILIETFSKILIEKSETYRFRFHCRLVSSMQFLSLCTSLLTVITSDTAVFGQYKKSCV